MAYKSRTINLDAHGITLDGFDEVVSIEMKSPAGSVALDKKGLPLIKRLLQRSQFEALKQYTDRYGEIKPSSDEEEAIRRAKAEEEEAKLTEDEKLARDVTQVRATLEAGSVEGEANEAVFTLLKANPKCLKFIKDDGTEIGGVVSSLDKVCDAEDFTFILAAYIDFLTSKSRK
jgi:hypothetical protein